MHACVGLQAVIGNYAVPILEDKPVWGTNDGSRTAYLDSQDVARMALAALRCACDNVCVSGACCCHAFCWHPPCCAVRLWTPVCGFQCFVYVFSTRGGSLRQLKRNTCRVACVVMVSQE